MKDTQLELRQHVLYLLRGGGAHLSFDEAIRWLPAGRRGEKAEGVPYTAWQLVEHMRIAQWDIVEFSISAKHRSPEWPSGYWPKTAAPPDAQAWTASASAFRRDLKRMEKLVADPRRDLYAKIPHGQGQTLLREALLVADHNAYHVGQLVVLRRLLGAWPQKSEGKYAETLS